MKRFWVGMLLAMAGAALIIGVDFLLHPRLGLGDSIAIISQACFMQAIT